MTALPDAQVLGTIILAIIGLGFAFVALRPIYMPVWQMFKKIQQFLDDWFGEPARPGQKERPGAMHRLAQLEANGGASLRDVVDKTKATNDRIEAQLVTLHDQVTAVQAVSDEATRAAAIAVGEAKASRAVIADLGEQSRMRVNEVREAIVDLANAVMHESDERHQKEVAYVAALNQIGVPLLPIADELEGGHL